MSPQAQLSSRKRSQISDPAADMTAPMSSAEPAAINTAPTREAALALLLRQGQATAADLARQLQVSVQVMRRHLRSLEEEGLVEASAAVEGPGRPSNRWQLTGLGHSQFPDGSGPFALGLLESMASSLPAGTMDALLEQQAQVKARRYHQLIGAGPLAERIERLVDLRRREGYVPECHLDPDVTGAWLVQEFHCSLMQIAEHFPGVCDQELQLLRHTFPDCQVERVHWRLEQGHACGFRIQATAAETSCCQATP